MKNEKLIYQMEKAAEDIAIAFVHATDHNGLRILVRVTPQEIFNHLICFYNEKCGHIYAQGIASFKTQIKKEKENV